MGIEQCTLDQLYSTCSHDTQQNTRTHIAMFRALIRLPKQHFPWQGAYLTDRCSVIYANANARFTSNVIGANLKQNVQI